MWPYRGMGRGFSPLFDAFAKKKLKRMLEQAV
jgi:hypothetical protein